MHKIYKQLELLHEVVSRSLSPQEVGTSKNLIFFIRRSLNQMSLYPEWHESEILIEAYLRVRQKVLAGHEVQKFPAYLTRVAQLIIFEKSKQRKRNYSISQKLSRADAEDDSAFSVDHSYTDGINPDTIDTLWSSFKALSEKDQEVLTLRIVHGYSWKEVAYTFVEWGLESHYSDSLIPKLRTQGKRALEKLRKGVLSVNN